MSEQHHHSHLGLGISLIAAATVFGLLLMLSVSNYKNFDRSVNVRGLCEREVMADRAIYPISFKEAGDNLPKLYAIVESKNQAICDFLKESGLEADEFSISAPAIIDNYSNSYSTQARTRYVMTSVITIYTTNVKTVLDIQSNLSRLLEHGIAIGSGERWENPIQFLFEGLNAIKPEMIREANKNARLAAEQFAKDSHSRLGKIKNAAQGYFTIEDRDSNTPHIKKVRVVTNVDYYLR
ncbi:MAG: SIMPL domain-containing protein [Bacteroidales bacterium]|nr:SIMPL domain-containing protein [Bacteroidales bacterium]